MKNTPLALFLALIAPSLSFAEPAQPPSHTESSAPVKVTQAEVNAAKDAAMQQLNIALAMRLDELSRPRYTAGSCITDWTTIGSDKLPVVKTKTSTTTISLPAPKTAAISIFPSGDKQSTLVIIRSSESSRWVPAAP